MDILTVLQPGSDGKCTDIHRALLRTHSQKKRQYFVEKYLRSKQDNLKNRGRLRKKWIEGIKEFGKRRENTLNEINIMARDNHEGNGWKNNPEPQLIPFRIRSSGERRKLISAL